MNYLAVKAEISSYNLVSSLVQCADIIYYTCCLQNLYLGVIFAAIHNWTTHVPCPIPSSLFHFFIVIIVISIPHHYLWRFMCVLFIYCRIRCSRLWTRFHCAGFITDKQTSGRLIYIFRRNNAFGVGWSNIFSPRESIEVLVFLITCYKCVSN